MSKNKKPTAFDVALAITKSCKVAGQSYSEHEPQDAETRAKNLTKVFSKYGPYIADGNPYGHWDGAVATILMEPKGVSGDCIPPLNYYDSGVDVSFEAGEKLKDHYIDFVNAAVAVVLPLGGE
jgi:hypothetical protein